MATRSDKLPPTFQLHCCGCRLAITNFCFHSHQTLYCFLLRPFVLFVNFAHAPSNYHDVHKELSD